MGKNYIYICILLSFVFIASPSLGQNQQIADSLTEYLEKNRNLNDSLKYIIFRDIATNSPKPDLILFYANQAYRLANKSNDHYKLGFSAYQIGQGYQALGNLPKALNAFLESENFFRHSDDLTGLGSVYIALASVYSVQNDYHKSFLFYDKAIQVFLETDDTFRLASTLHNKGNAFRKLAEYDSALTYFNTSLSLSRQLNIDILIAYNYGSIGVIMGRKGNVRECETKINQAITILKRLGDNYAIADFSIQLADIYQMNGRVSEALPIAVKALKLARQDGLKEQIRDASLKLSELYAQTKDYEKAHYHHTKYVAYRDSISNEEVIRKMADLRTEHEVSQKQAEIDLLTKQRQINKLIGIGLVFFTLLLAALAFVLFRNNRIKKAANRILSSQKEELEVQHHKLEALNHTKDRFFSIISHDLRGPVNAFNGLSGLIKHYISRNEMGQLREVSEYIDKSARQLSGLLDNLLDWAVKQQGAFPFHPEKIYLNSVLQEIEEMFGITAHAKNVILTVNVDEEIVLWADRNSFTTILRNLVNNALKFTEPEGLVTISAYTQKNYAFINIMDTGVGIPEEQLDKLFQVKDKVSSRGTSGEKGLGIGLSLAYEFTKMNKGTIMVNSEEKAGTIFTVKIPLYGSSKKSSLKSAEPAEENTFSG